MLSFYTCLVFIFLKFFGCCDEDKKTIPPPKKQVVHQPEAKQDTSPHTTIPPPEPAITLEDNTTMANCTACKTQVCKCPNPTCNEVVCTACASKKGYCTSCNLIPLCWACRNLKKQVYTCCNATCKNVVCDQCIENNKDMCPCCEKTQLCSVCMDLQLEVYTCLSSKRNHAICKSCFNSFKESNAKQKKEAQDNQDEDEVGPVKCPSCSAIYHCQQCSDWLSSASGFYICPNPICKLPVCATCSNGATSCPLCKKPWKCESCPDQLEKKYAYDFTDYYIYQCPYRYQNCEKIVCSTCYPWNDKCPNCESSWKCMECSKYIELSPGLTKQIYPNDAKILERIDRLGALVYTCPNIDCNQHKHMLCHLCFAKLCTSGSSLPPCPTCNTAIILCEF